MNYLFGLISGLIFNHFWNNYRNADLRQKFEKEWKQRREAISDLRSESWLD